MDYKECLRAHGYINSDDSDSGSCNSDELYKKSKPPPIPFEYFRDKIVVIRAGNSVETNNLENYNQPGEASCENNPQRVLTPNSNKVLLTSVNNNNLKESWGAGKKSKSPKRKNVPSQIVPATNINYQFILNDVISIDEGHSVCCEVGTRGASQSRTRDRSKSPRRNTEKTATIQTSQFPSAVEQKNRPIASPRDNPTQPRILTSAENYNRPIYEANFRSSSLQAHQQVAARSGPTYVQIDPVVAVPTPRICNEPQRQVSTGNSPNLQTQAQGGAPPPQQEEIENCCCCIIF